MDLDLQVGRGQAAGFGLGSGGMCMGRKGEEIGWIFKQMGELNLMNRD